MLGESAIDIERVLVRDVLSVAGFDWRALECAYSIELRVCVMVAMRLNEIGDEMMLHVIEIRMR